MAFDVWVLNYCGVRSGGNGGGGGYDKEYVVVLCLLKCSPDDEPRRRGCTTHSRSDFAREKKKSYSHMRTLSVIST